MLLGFLNPNHFNLLKKYPYVSISNHSKIDLLVEVFRELMNPSHPSDPIDPMKPQGRQVPPDSSSSDLSSESFGSGITPHEHVLEPGRRIGNYMVAGFLGRGGFGRVYKGENRQDGSKVALKVSDSAGGSGTVRLDHISGVAIPEAVSAHIAVAVAIDYSNPTPKKVILPLSLCNELLVEQHNILARLSECKRDGGSRFVDVLAKTPFEYKGSPISEMKYLRGETLRDIITRCEGVKSYWFRDIALDLARLNEQGILDAHRDLKPENIFITDRGAILLDPSPDPKKFHKTLITTPEYNPLQLCDSRGDVMALGIMIYEILTGVTPFDQTIWDRGGLGFDWSYFNRSEIDQNELSFRLSYDSDLMFRTIEIDKLTPLVGKIVHKALTLPDYSLREMADELNEVGKNK